MPTAKTPSLLCTAEYLGDELYASYSRLKQHYQAAAPDARPALLSELGLASLFMDGCSALRNALEELESLAIDKCEDTHQMLARALKRCATDLTISPELAAYIRALPEHERQRGEVEAEALRKLPKRKKRRQTLAVAPDKMPVHYESAAKSAQALLTLDQVVAKAQRIVEKRSSIRLLSGLIGAHSPGFWYPETPIGVKLK